MEQLQQIVPPPATLVAAGSPEGWAQVEAELGTRLPADYKQLVHVYGYGEFGRFFILYNPFRDWGRGNLLYERQSTLEVYEDVREGTPDGAYPSYPEPGGVLPLGQTTNGDAIFWITEGDPDGWGVLLSEMGVFEEAHACTATGLLVGAFTGAISSSILPGDISTGPNEFKPIRSTTLA